jgi:threonine dehydratase
VAPVTVRSVSEPSPADVLRAGEIVGRHLSPTPVLASPLLGADVALKVETFQPTGSFKVRGALVAVASALAQDPDGLVVTASAGNHGLGVAFAAHTFGVKAVVVIPENASEAKRGALERFDVDIVRHGTTYEESETHALSLADELGGGARFVSPYNDPDVIAGQGTIALELFDQVPGLSTMVAPVGGGGLVAGLALAARHRSGVGVRGAEAEASPAVSRSVSAGRTVTVPIGDTLADGLAGNLEPGSVTVPLIARGVEQLVGVDEESIREAVRFLAFEHGLVVEPSGAVAVAALLSGRMEPGPGPTVVLVTGRNLAPSLLARLLAGER